MSQRLLLADDSVTIQRVVELVLARDDFEIRAYGDGEQALEAMKSFEPDVVLADIEMPKVNGYQLCEEIKKNEATSHIPVILLAGAFEPFDEGQAKSVGADGFLIKPFDGEELIRKIKASLSAVEPLEEAFAEAGEGRESSTYTVMPEEVVAGEGVIEEAQRAEEGASAALWGFVEELHETPREVSVTTDLEEVKNRLELPSMEETSRLLSEILKEKVEEVLNMSVIPEVSSRISSQIDTTLSQIAPTIVENVTRQVIGDLVASLRSDIELQIRRIVPEIAETIIQREVERIAREF